MKNFRPALLNLLLFCCALGVDWQILGCGRVHAQTAAAGEAEAQKCEERIASVRRDVLSRYDDALGELQLAFQKAADLEGALAVRAERKRANLEQTLAESDVVNEPKTLRAIQQQMITKMKELTSQLVQETVPKLIELKRSLTVAGKLDDAVAVRAAIERLQTSHVPIARPNPLEPIPAELLLQAYSADRTRADKTYKGQKITVRGVVGAFRQDPGDAKQFQVYLAGNNSTGWIQCSFSTADFRFREEQQFNNTFLVVSARNNENASVRWQKGQTAEIRGICDGFDETVRLTKSEFVR
jgi:hypothetical protein